MAGGGVVYQRAEDQNVSNHGDEYARVHHRAVDHFVKHSLIALTLHGIAGEKQVLRDRHEEKEHGVSIEVQVAGAAQGVDLAKRDVREKLQNTANGDVYRILHADIIAYPDVFRDNAVVEKVQPHLDERRDHHRREHRQGFVPYLLFKRNYYI